jgi:hypothetical protein
MGVPNGGMVKDACGICGGDGTECAGCDGVPRSGKVLDACGNCLSPVADADLFNRICADCMGVPFGNATYDACGNCLNAGDPARNDSCSGCDGNPNSGLVFDQCGVCGGNGQSCLGCDGVPFSNFRNDECGDCLALSDPEFNKACADCSGWPNGGRIVRNDECNECSYVRSFRSTLSVCFLFPFYLPLCASFPFCD